MAAGASVADALTAEPASSVASEARAESQARGERRYRYPRTPFVPRPRIGSVEDVSDAVAAPADTTAVVEPSIAPATIAVPEVPVPAGLTVVQPAVAAAPEPVAVMAAATLPPTEEKPAVTPPQASATAEPLQATMPHVVPPAPLKLDWSNDLMQIETDRAKLQAALAAAAMVNEPPRKPRVRPVLPPLSNEPLVQVETRQRESAAL